MFPCTLTFAAAQMAGVRDAALAGMCSGLPVRVEEGDLPRRTSVVCREQLVERRSRIAALGEQREPRGP